MRRTRQANQEDRKETEKPKVPPKQLKSKVNEKTHFFSRNSKFFRINFEKMFAISACNRIKIMTAREFTIIDVSSHCLKILTNR